MTSFPKAFALIFGLFYFCDIGVNAREVRLRKTTRFLRSRAAASPGEHASTKKPSSINSVLNSTKKPEMKMHSVRVLQNFNKSSTKAPLESESILNTSTKEPIGMDAEEHNLETRPSNRVLGQFDHHSTKAPNKASRILESSTKEPIRNSRKEIHADAKPAKRVLQQFENHSSKAPHMPSSSTKEPSGDAV